VLQAPTTESNQKTSAARTAAEPEPQRTLHPRYGSFCGSGGVVGPDSGPAQLRRQAAGLQRTVGNQQVLRLLKSSHANWAGDPPTRPTRCPLAVQCASDTTAISADGKKQPQLSTTSGEGGTENVENPELALAQIEAGTPPGEGQDPGGQAGNGTLRKEPTVVQTARAPLTSTPMRISPQAVLGQLGGGEPIRSSLRFDMETGLGHDFSSVRVHNDASAGALAVSLGAHAFAVGEHIAFAPGLYQPGTGASRKLIAHELAHVVQQRRGLTGSILRRGIGSAGDPYEQEAEAVAERVCRGTPSAPTRDSKPTNSHGSGAGAVQCFSGSDAAAYAKTWATKTNPKYLRFDDDCTNFVSQAMEAGGWAYKFGSSDLCDDFRSDSVWWFRKDGCKRLIRSNVDASFTWGGAQNFSQFVRSSGRATLAANVYDLEVGDVLQRDHGDNHMHHSMVVTEKGTETVDGTPNTKQISLSYHTNDTLNKKFWGRGNILDGSNAGWKYYGWKIK
jgi:hypothetical protein